MQMVRPAAVAGSFYPANAQALRAELDELLGGVQDCEPRLGFPKALIVPHAGYMYSGAVAARAYDELVGARGVVRRVVLLGPVHRVAVRGLAVPSVEAFATPAGEVRVDRDALRSLRELPQVVTSDAAHALEHSLEVQLPFLQKVLGDFKLVPFAVGTASAAEVAQVLQQLWGERETVIVISTDLSHYHAYEEARRLDAATLARIEGLATDLDHEEACGATPLNGLLAAARRRGLTVRQLAACNSGDSAGGKAQVVGYAAFALYEAGEVTPAEAGAKLVSIAADSIAADLGLGAPPSAAGAHWLEQAGATFVTLLRAGRLRGCIGSLEAVRALGVDVAENARGAAFRDPRFPALGSDEWAQCTLEVSLLSSPRLVQFADEEHLLSLIRAGEDGLILEADGRCATFLPQVWEGFPDKRAFLAALVKKAGLPADTRLARCRISRYGVVKFDGR
jgi:AmmeMemoRadiSam system protein B/AmmeMemoRadiSam system protein A